jgi:hypothetical protein
MSLIFPLTKTSGAVTIISPGGSIPIQGLNKTPFEERNE